MKPIRDPLQRHRRLTETDESAVTAANGREYRTRLYSLEAIIAVGYRSVIIGTDTTRIRDLGNEVGVVSWLGASHNTIGGTESRAGNAIAFNRDSGVALSRDWDPDWGWASGNALLGSLIYATGNPDHPNRGLGIDLGWDGPTRDDSGNAHHLWLRAERDGSGNGRIYTVMVTCADACGNATSKAVTVTAPKSQGNK